MQVGLFGLKVGEVFQLADGITGRDVRRAGGFVNRVVAVVVRTAGGVVVLERGDAEVGRGLLVGLSGDEGGFDVVDDGHDVGGLKVLVANLDSFDAGALVGRVAAPEGLEDDPSAEQLAAASEPVGALQRGVEAEPMAVVPAGLGVAEDELGEGVGFRRGDDVCVIHVWVVVD